MGQNQSGPGGAGGGGEKKEVSISCELFAGRPPDQIFEIGRRSGEEEEV